MKCPKCSYLGFDTGDRCKNCGYDFSLIEPASEPIEIDLDLRTVEADALDPVWQAQVDGALAQPRPVGPTPVDIAVERDSRFPLFPPMFPDGDDEPLIKVPSVPRPPLAVRRTPDTPRLRAFPKAIEVEPLLKFEEDPDTLADQDVVDERPRRPVSRVWADPASVAASISLPGPRVMAAAIDLLMLGAIDVAVMYFTLRMAGLPMTEWTSLPAAPFIVFLLLVKIAYFCAFTAVGGQTIGKMAAHIRVVNADGNDVDPALALRRTLAGTVSAALLGVGFLPAFFDTERRTLHDRLARTRVVGLRSA